MSRQLVNIAEKTRWGVVTRAQLIAAGLRATAVDGALKRGELRLVHRGVYALGQAPLRDERVWLAAVLACGPDAVLSHTSAGRLWGMRTPRGDTSLTSPSAVPKHAPRSTPARAFRGLCRDAALPMPRFNAMVLGAERDADLVAARWRVVRFSYHQVVHEPAAVAARLASFLG